MEDALKYNAGDDGPTKVAKQKARSAVKRFYAAQLRNNPTPAEEVMREALKGVGVKFGFQKIICGFIPDFWCAELRLVVEVDGPIHARKRAEDKRRDDVMRGKGITVLRFTNNEVLADAAACVEKIRRLVKPIRLRGKRRRQAIARLKREQRRDRAAAGGG